MSFSSFFVYRHQFYKLNDNLTKHWGEGKKGEGVGIENCCKKIEENVVLGVFSCTDSDFIIYMAILFKKTLQIKLILSHHCVKYLNKTIDFFE